MNALPDAVVTALVQSLWQDTLAAGVLALVLVAMRRRSPSARYLSACAALCAMAVWPLATAIAAYGQMSSAVAASGFAATRFPATLPVAITVAADAVRAPASGLVEPRVLPLWLAGVLVCSLRLVASRIHIASLTRGASTADAALQHAVARMAIRMGVTRPVRILRPSTGGAATLGWRRPVILMPAAAMVGLTLQLAAETVFFYHPAVWWVSRRMRVERELCCDDAAVAACGDPHAYARALATMAGVLPRPAIAAAGGSLRARIERLLGVTSARGPLSARGGLTAATLAMAFAVCAVGWVHAQQSPAPQRFEVASVKPNRSGRLEITIDVPAPRRFVATNVPLRNLLRFAYDVDAQRLIGGPDWVQNERFDIVATTDRDLPAWTTAGPPPLVLAMLRSLLADRFGLRTHQDTRELPVYALVLARSDRTLGPRASVSAVDCSILLEAHRGATPHAAPGGTPQCGMRIGPGQMLLDSVPMRQFATMLTPFVQRVVVDRTELTGNFNLQLSWTPPGRSSQGAPPPTNAPALPPVDPNGASLFASIQEQLGLKLEPARAAVDVVIIDAVERPTPD